MKILVSPHIAGLGAIDNHVRMNRLKSIFDDSKIKYSVGAQEVRGFSHTVGGLTLVTNQCVKNIDEAHELLLKINRELDINLISLLDSNDDNYIINSSDYIMKSLDIKKKVTKGSHVKRITKDEALSINHGSILYINNNFYLIAFNR